MVAHITYLSEASIENKFGRRLQDASNFTFDLIKEIEFQVESYLHYQGRRFVDRFDANSYVYLTKAMDFFDLEKTYGSLNERFCQGLGAVPGCFVRQRLALSHAAEQRNRALARLGRQARLVHRAAQRQGSRRLSD